MAIFKRLHLHSIQLKLLNASNNQITYLPESIGSCFALEELQANEISIKPVKVPGAPEQVTFMLQAEDQVLMSYYMVTNICLEDNKRKAHAVIDNFAECRAQIHIDLFLNCSAKP
ncbi:uncharacterized protein LOC141611913 isoform X2 [Silene latifolia]|uniref:uncharacterized protein LOC141611913 isoform X2 n=1 Tax=Silene latifolia TaxID=37657 RepID=UPI003D7838D6